MRKTDNNNFFTKELWGFTFVLFSVLVMLCLIGGDYIFNPIGGKIRGFMFGLAGYFAYPLFVFIGLTGFCMIAGRNPVKGDARLTVDSLGLLFCLVFCILQLSLTSKIISGDSFSEYTAYCMNAGKNGLSGTIVGGALFGALVYPMTKLLSIAGAYCFYSILIIITGIFMFRSRIFGRRSDAKYEKKPIGENLSAAYKSNGQDMNAYAVPTGVKTNVYGNPVEKNENAPAFYSNDGKGKLRVMGNFELKENGDEDLRKNSTEILFNRETPKNNSMGEGKSSYTAKYSDDFASKLNYIKKPRKTVGGIEKENSYGVSDKIANGNNVPDAIFHDVDLDDSQPNEDIYIPENYRRAVSGSIGKAENIESKNLFSENGAKEDKNGFDIFGGGIIDDSAADDKIIDPSKLHESPLSYKKPEPTNLGRETIGKIMSGDTDSRERFNDVPEPPAQSVNIFKDKEPERISVPANERSAERKEEKVSAIENMPLNYRYNAPPVELLKVYSNTEDYGKIERFKEEKASIILKTLKVLGGVDADVVNIVHGPTVTRFDIAIPENISIKNVTKLSEDLNLRLATKNDIRITTIPGTPYIGIEIPNDIKSVVGLRDVISSSKFNDAKKTSLTFALGKDIVGNPVVADISKMPHLLIAGSTGTGKSVCLNSLIISLMYKYGPEDLRFVIVDPKQVEFTVFNGTPHMMFNEILCDTPRAIAMLNWAVKEMESRYGKLKDAMVHNIEEYNAQIDPRKEHKIPRIVIIIDEYADLMSVDKKNIEDKIARIAQKARAAGIFLILATQRPSVDIVEGSIKTNFTSRIAFKMSNNTDSLTILGETGAEKLLGAGDLLYRTSTMSNTERVQGAYIDMAEIKAVVQYVKDNNTAYYDDTALSVIDKECAPQIEDNGMQNGNADSVPDVYIKALKMGVDMGVMSISLMQRKFSLGYPKAAKIMDWMTDNGYVLTNQNGKQRQVVITKEQFADKFGDVD